jgi:protein tyrosine/serine phosphatase
MTFTAKSVSRRLAALVVAWSLVLSGSALADAPAAHGDLSAIHIKNFGRVTEHYYRGAAPDDAEYGTLASFGIKTIVDLRGDDVDAGDQSLVERAGMTYVRMPMTTHQPPTAAMIQAFLELVADPARQPVYVHCVGGRHRTGVMTAVYRMTQEGWTADQAFREMKKFRFGADFLHPEFKRFVYEYRPTPSSFQAAAGGAERQP